LWFWENLHYVFWGFVAICILIIIIISRIIRARDARLALKKHEIEEKQKQWEKSYYLQHFDRSLEELSGMPGDTEIGPDGYPCERGTSSWGKKYTFYRSHSGAAFHSNPSCSSIYGLLPVHAWTIYNSSLYPCGKCKPVLPDLRWFSRYKANQAIAKKYGIIPPQYQGPSADYSRAMAAESRIKELGEKLAQSEIARRKAEQSLQELDPKRVKKEIELQSIDLIRQRTNEVLQREIFRKSSLAFDVASRIPLDANARLLRAIREGPEIIPPVQVTARIRGHDGIYTTTLNDCTCKDFSFNHEPCKHMYQLAISLGLTLYIRKKDVEAALSHIAENAKSRKGKAQ